MTHLEPPTKVPSGHIVVLPFARMLLGRTIPNKRPEQERVEIEHSDNIASDAQNVLRVVFDGEVSPDVGASLLASITGVLKAIEVEELAKRIEALEDASQ
jgi:hypothetical protein